MSYGSFTTTAYLEGVGTAVGDSTGFSICAWVKMDSTAWDDVGVKNILSFGAGGGSSVDSMKIRTNGTIASPPANRATGRIEDSSGSFLADEEFTQSLADSEWIPITVTFDGTSAGKVIVRDSAQKGTGSRTTSIGTVLDTVTVGVSQTYLNEADQGCLIAEVCIWKKVLSDAEIDSLWTSTNTGPAPNTVASADVVGYWPLDTDQASHADQSGSDFLNTGGITLSENGTVAYSSDHPTITRLGTNEGATGRGILRGVMRGVL